MRTFRIAVLAIALLAPAPFARAESLCGNSPDDWCTSAKDGACGRHMDTKSCMADSACKGMAYSGETLVACHWDENGYADNCPTVGCLDK